MSTIEKPWNVWKAFALGALFALGTAVLLGLAEAPENGRYQIAAWAGERGGDLRVGYFVLDTRSGKVVDAYRGTGAVGK